MKPTVVIGMSGGVDSSVSALLLKEQGYHVIGMFMKNWDEKNDPNSQCQASLEYEDVVRVCDQLQIPYYSVNFAKEYWDHVFSHCLHEFRQGNTPNPDILCNKEVKFKLMFEKALSLGADYLATGHYCRVGSHLGKSSLMKGSDPGKDQSYFLYTVSSDILSKVLFPVGNMHKSEVREIAKKHGLSTAEKKDSTGICFIGERDFKPFLMQFIQGQPGNFEDLEGNILGQHDGVAFYTPGQRKGLGIGGAGEPWFVAGKDIARNVVTLVQGANHPALYRDSLVARDIVWADPLFAPTIPFACHCKIRYRQEDQACQITELKDGVANVSFDSPQRAISPGQSIVFYSGDLCLGGGIIS